MYEHLVKNLRDDTALQNCEFDFVHAWMHEAADAIEELKKQLDNAEIENIKLKEEFAKYRGKNRWIPVAERLPEIGKKVLVLAYDNDTLTARMQKRTENGFPVFECNGIFLEMAKQGRITHWMPTPEPPESEDK